MEETRERAEPRISVNKLGEYMVATPRRRRRIISDQKRPSPFIVPRYTEATEAIVDYLVSSAVDDEVLVEKADTLLSTAGETEWQEQTNQLCAEAISCFLDIVDDLPLDDIEIRRGDPNPEQLEIGGVMVSVRPEMVLCRTDRTGSSTVGALKLSFSKTFPLDDISGDYVATIIQRYVTEKIADGRTVDRSICLVVDVFTGKVYEAPRAYKRRWADLEAAGEEIARAWPVV